VRYRSRRPSEAELRKKLRDLANERRRFRLIKFVFLILAITCFTKTARTPMR
ncbi:hypothetical protein GOB44_33510, partial [Sinorhizobium meliloti]|nr:hypothetical protein [Sinorhizobium meliloti]MDW9751821.1 hypothetical protein [Sinorhizobium meliloti]MDX0359876.1 hypothetical protein [Sinorhizobium meliloti]